MSSNPRKQDESKPQPQASAMQFQAIVDNPHFTETQKRDLLRSMMERQLKKGDDSFMNTDSPSTKGFLGTLAAINEYANTPDRPFLRRQQYNDFIGKKIDTLLPFQMDPPPAPQAEAGGPRRLEFPKSTIPVMQIEDTNNISKVDSKSVASPVEKGNESIPPCRTAVGKNDYFFHDLKEWVPNNVAEALYMMGPTAELKRTKSHKGRTRTGYQSRLFHCAIKGCSMRWLVQAAEWHGSNPYASANPSKRNSHSNTTWHGSNPYVFVKPSHENHNGHENVTWEDHFNHLTNHGSKDKCDQCEIFRTGIGLPPILKLELRNLVLSNPENTPKVYARSLETKWEHLPIFRNKSVRDIIQTKVISYVHRFKEAILGKDNLPRMKYYGDIRSFIDKYVLPQEALLNMKMFGVLPFSPDRYNEDALKQLSFLMQQYGAITTKNTLSNGDNPLWRRLFCLRDPSIVDHPRYKQLMESPRHTTGPDPFNRTVVFTSLALLGNILSSKEIGFECCASADGTHGVSLTDYKLIPFGVFFHNSKGNRQFFPIAYAFGEGEREVVILILLLNIKRVARDLFGVSNLQFVGGIVSDHSAAFVNSFKEVFEDTTPLQCYIHIIRKFENPETTRPTNGKYRDHLSTRNANSTRFLYTEALQDVRNLHDCVTFAQFQKYWELTKESWVSKGEAKLAETFEGVYISNPDYNQWYYTSSGIRGCVPDNNPLESHNGATKGTSDVRGLIIINRSMENALQVEFPRMIDTLSREKIIPNTDFHPTLDITLAFSNNNFLKLREEYLADGTTTQYNGGWLVNDTEFLGEPITPQSISCYETSLLGVFHDSYTKRQELVTNTNRYHHVLPATTKNGVPVHVCSCRHYWLHRWCYASWYIQHKDTLKNDSQKIGKNEGQPKS
ncbi:MULE transposase domain containing protein [Nitzschia inconspicua]|uniref:MULE transposase domain containing protein n=1 Tax=Nitzschia inconspicua TaxID=303405 RepID=A0A9K3L6M1_9STRA|nr:MULE transposase domain containing protein [Nitzschia inconspicua]